MFVGDPELLPVPHLGRVLGLPGEEPALLGRPHLADPLPLVGQL